MQDRLTEDLVAYDLYTRGKNLVLTASGRSTAMRSLEIVNGLFGFIQGQMNQRKGERPDVPMLGQ